MLTELSTKHVANTLNSVVKEITVCFTFCAASRTMIDSPELTVQKRVCSHCWTCNINNTENRKSILYGFRHSRIKIEMNHRIAKDSQTCYKLVAVLFTLIRCRLRPKCKFNPCGKISKAF